MSPNKDLPHILVLPEDDANLKLANGFHLRVPSQRERQMQVLGVAGGWRNVLDLFKSAHVMKMDRYPERLMVLLIDLDGHADRLDTAKDIIPERLADRVFVLGALSEPEDLKTDLGSYEIIGSAMADDCHKETNATWGHPLLQHNVHELNRLREVRSSDFVSGYLTGAQQVGDHMPASVVSKTKSNRSSGLNYSAPCRRNMTPPMLLLPAPFVPVNT